MSFTRKISILPYTLILLMTRSSELSTRNCLTMAKTKKVVETAWYKTTICQKFWYVFDKWLFWYINNVWKSQKWLKLKILVYKPVYVKIWYTWFIQEKSQIKMYYDFLLWVVRQKNTHGPGNVLHAYLSDLK